MATRTTWDLDETTAYAKAARAVFASTPNQPMAQLILSAQQVLPMDRRRPVSGPLRLLTKQLIEGGEVKVRGNSISEALNVEEPKVERPSKTGAPKRKYTKRKPAVVKVVKRKHRRKYTKQEIPLAAIPSPMARGPRRNKPAKVKTLLDRQRIAWEIMELVRELL